jgi:hypothetical protein
MSVKTDCTTRLLLLLNMKLKLLLFLFLLSFSSLKAQYTNVINSNKPGFSESPYSVGTGVYQLESNIFYRNTSIEPTFSRPESFGVDFLFRTSFFIEKLELNTQFSYQKDKIAFKNIFDSNYSITGISKLTVGAKYLFFEQKIESKLKEVRSWKKRFAFDWKRMIPSVAGYVGINIDAVNSIYTTGSVSPKIGVLLQNDLTSDFNIITNFYYDKIGTDFSEFSYIITGTYSLNDRWSTFFENQGATDQFQTRSNIATGLAFLQSPNLQINSSLRLLFEGESSGYYVGFGVSYRYNRHKDKVIFYDDNGNIIKKDPTITYSKSTGGFFGKFLNLFKKKREQKVEPIKTGKRKRPQRVRKKSFITKEKKKGGFFSKLLGKKSKKKKAKKNKKKETETEKLEREIKELEDEIKKNGN